VQGEPVFVARAHAVVRVREALEKAAAVDVRLVLYGETGVGKFHAAQFLHALSPRAEAPLVRLSVRDLRALETLSDPSFARSVAGGTLVLEAVDEASPEVQGYLVAALEEWGTSEDHGTALVRVVATAERDLGVLEAAGVFRRDLHFLLDVFPLALPALRSRTEEISLFLEHFHRRLAPGKPVPPAPAEFLEQALVYSWPGNLRELLNLVASSVTMTGGDEWALPRVLPRRGDSPEPPPFHQAKREFEAGYVRRLLLLTGGNVSRAADMAGKARKDFYALLSRNGIDPAGFRR
jgi:two-component system response regulator GlrR